MEQQPNQFNAKLPIPDKSESFGSDKIFAGSLKLLVDRFIENRERLRKILPSLGLNPLLAEDSRVVIGPATMAFPLPTMFGNDLGEVVSSFRRDKVLADVLRSRGFSPINFFQLPLLFSAVSTGGDSSLDVLKTSPRCKPFNLIAEPEELPAFMGRSYNSLVGDVPRLMFDLRESLRVGSKNRKNGEIILEEILSDLDLAMSKTVRYTNSMGPDTRMKFNYIQFIDNLNRIIIDRIKKITTNDIPSSSFFADNIYREFMTNGIVDENRFLLSLLALGVIEVGKPAFKFEEEGEMKKLVITVFSTGEVALMEQKSGRKFKFSEARKFPSFVPMKELNYALLMGSFLPWIYADDNNRLGSGYKPYSIAIAQLSSVKLNPVAYPFQTRKNLNFPVLDIFNFYEQLLG
jgi:hypothetical protein